MELFVLVLILTFLLVTVIGLVWYIIYLNRAMHKVQSVVAAKEKNLLSYIPIDPRYDGQFEPIDEAMFDQFGDYSL